MTDGADELRWAPRVPRASIRRLYESDARGLLDQDLLDEVFFGFLARCQSIATATEAAFRRVRCPRCGHVIVRRVRDRDEKKELLRCASCAWQTTWGAYHRTYQGKQLSGGNAIGVFEEFLRRAPAASLSAREKMLLVDWLVHEAHKTVLSGREEFHRPTAVNVIEGRMKEIIAFLDDLAYGPSSTPGVRESADRWREHVRPRLGRKDAHVSDRSASSPTSD